ncbi:uncharacterized protein LOC111265514 isoform X4 [Varroa jacobsoni]|uniref:uncharacterized protein LOC111265514 isoform X4 n=1 Tax=Varroa jacobsoni TaxID=62625 RepID=UPI000BF35692|nr:uncharacterized protein LOC111265514 isoform X4 [Varroa jacobsoni]XP_022698004.1 uncharacterized protein LOC111265514 isoform X4 [Varroa jacobsoni]
METVARKTNSRYKPLNVVDAFKPAPHVEIDEAEDSSCAEATTRVIKALSFVVTFVIILGSAITSRMSLLLMVSQLDIPHGENMMNVVYYNRTNQSFNRSLPMRVVCSESVLGLSPSSKDNSFSVSTNKFQAVVWTWVLLLCLITPECLKLLVSVKLCLFKPIIWPSATTLGLTLFMEGLHAFGCAWLTFGILPKLNVVHGAMLANCVFFVPAMIRLCHSKCFQKIFTLESVWEIVVRVVVVIFQLSGLLAWALLDPQRLWGLPFSLILISCGWWENFIGATARLLEFKEHLQASKTITNILLAIWKSFIFLIVAVAITGQRVSYWQPEPDYGALFSNLPDAYHGFSVAAFETDIYINSLLNEEESIFAPLFNVSNVTLLGQKETSPVRVKTSLKLVGEIRSPKWTPLLVGLIHVLSSYLCYSASTFACQVGIQHFSMAFPLLLGVPFTTGVLGFFCALQADDSCFTMGLPGSHFYNCLPQGPDDSIEKFLLHKYTWMWLLWLVSQTQMTSYIWRSAHHRMAKVSKLFMNSYYCPVCVEQSIMAFRRRDDPTATESGLRTDPEPSHRSICSYSKFVEADSPDVSDHSIVRIIACATMWHETEAEMIQLLKSVLRMSVDQCSMQRNDPDYYELEAEILFDDAFETTDGVRRVNRYVKTLITAMDVAVSKVYGAATKIKLPKKVSTPYGGRLEWDLPSLNSYQLSGKTRLFVHLKDKTLIRARKRWSQVMYMYYLLGYCFHKLSLNDYQKKLRSRNTFLLALDGDINFRPHAVKLLVDLMKNNPSLGAACGRIHPVGSGPIVWYQKFEYAVGHWLQKATEHIFGCVLCSPGCFSLFRAEALMANGVMQTYTTECTEPQHYVQYDQGEDRWLCTLLLQRGYGVEYSAASDAHTYAPESFSDFFRQRRRWGPSTLANIVDLLLSAKQTIKINANISVLYIMYQFMLLIGNIIGPGNIFMMMVGSFVTVFSIAIYKAMLINLVPVLLFVVVCFFCKDQKQIFLAQVLSFLYALVMTAVLMGIVIQINDEGLGSPSAMFFVTLCISFTVTALLHPRELLCILHGILYFLLVPAMYLFLTIYSVMNLHVVVWGTREKPPTAEEQRIKEEEQQVKYAEKAKNSIVRQLINAILNWRNGDTTLNNTLEELTSKIDKVLTIVGSSNTEISASSGGLTNSNRSDNEPQQSNAETEGEENKVECDVSEVAKEVDLPLWKTERMCAWQSDPEVPTGPNTELHEHEVRFWNDMLDEFLRPPEESIQDRKAMQRSLIELRNNICSAYFMLNALYVLALFFLQINKDSLFIEWPFGGNHTIQFVPITRQVTITRYYLHLDPIGLGFVVFFAVVLFVQFLGMLLHRLETFKYVLAVATVRGQNSRTGRRGTITQAVGHQPSELLSNDSLHSAISEERHADITDKLAETEQATETACDEVIQLCDTLPFIRSNVSSTDTGESKERIDNHDHPPGAQGDANYDLLAIQLEHSSSDALAQTTGNAASADSQDVPFYEVTLVDQHFVPSNELTNRTHASDSSELNEYSMSKYSRKKRQGVGSKAVSVTWTHLASSADSKNHF